ncbi:MAG: hypothetical protein HC769_15875 [Cyanobacteria bacterium CRU_2_1]|nr:hypothetical protein [Cyanobacteria bacterium CRU_2_1]
MNTVSIENPAQRLYIPNLIAEFSGYQVAGCLQIYVGSDFWLIYLDQGKLIFASNSVEPFGRLNRHLRRLSIQTPSLVSAVVQVRLLFERSGDRQMYSSQDYQAICWLVEQQYLTPAQATLLIEELAKEVLESLLSVQAEYYRFQEQECFNQFLKFCQLDPQALIKYCQAKPQSDQTLQTSKQVAPVVDSKLSRQMDTSF